MKITLPELCLVALVGVSGSGKSTFGRKHFLATEVISSDRCRALVADDENDQAATGAAFELVHTIAAARLKAGRMTVIDATSVKPEDRRPLVQQAKNHHVFAYAIVLDVPPEVATARNALRPDRQFGSHVIRNQRAALRRSIGQLHREGFRKVFVLRGVEEIEAAVIEREPLWTDRRGEHGPFDLIGDVHGCHIELVELLTALGYAVAADGTDAVHPSRRAVFLGDLVDRGPASPAVLRLAMNMVRSGAALCIPGNHENKLQRALDGKQVTLSHGLALTMEQLALETEEFRGEVKRFIEGLVSHAVLDGGRLVVAHAGLPEAMHNRSSGAVRSFALYGDTTGETDEFGLPVRYPWADDYRGRAAVVYGHTPLPYSVWINGTICVDTGCVFGGALTALRWPERELVSVTAHATYYEPKRPLTAAPTPSSARGDRPADVLDLDDVTGKRIIPTTLNGTVTVREENAAAALEVMSRFAIDPHWLVYLPPTMSPPATTACAGLLEHPAEAFTAYSEVGVTRVICEEKHMGSRAVVVVCRSAEVGLRRFGIAGDGAIHTRTGRAFFPPDLTSALLARVRAAFDEAGMWDELATDWAVLDCELLPWSAKAEDLLRTQYAAVGAAATASMRAEAAVLGAAAERFAALPPLVTSTSLASPDVATLRSDLVAPPEVSTRSTGREAAADVAHLSGDPDRHDLPAAEASQPFERGDVGPAHLDAVARLDMADRFVDAYRRYCWPTDGLDGVRLAPFQVLATEGRVRALDPHPWHMAFAARLAAADPATFRATRTIEVDLADPASESAAIAWWEQLTGAGGEGMVVKPVDVVVRGERDRLLQPGVKCRGPEYLRIIYGPEYTTPRHLARLRERGLGHKRSLAVREFALGIESLERFVAGEPLYRVHECVFGVLALESEPVDPRL